MSRDGLVFWRVMRPDPAVPSLLRRAFQAWLREPGGPADQPDNLVLAFNEAVTNVVDHAYAPSDSVAARPGRRDIRVRAEATPSYLIGEIRRRVTQAR